MAPELRRRSFTAPIDSERCIANARTAVKGEGARCMHRAFKGTRYCRQHALDPKLREAMLAAGSTMLCLSGLPECVVVPDHRRRLALFGQALLDYLEPREEPLHASPSPSASEDTRAESVAQVPASVKGAVRAWDRSGCRETVCYCHDEASTPCFCGHCGCRPEQAQVRP